MRQYTEQNLVIHPGQFQDANLLVEVTPEIAGWEHIFFQARMLACPIAFTCHAIPASR